MRTKLNLNYDAIVGKIWSKDPAGFIAKNLVLAHLLAGKFTKRSNLQGRRIRCALSNSFAFGGLNAVLALRSASDNVFKAR